MRRLNRWISKKTIVQSLWLLALTPGLGFTQPSPPDSTRIASAPTVPDSLVRERLSKLQKQVPLTYHSSVQSYIDFFTFRRASTTKAMLERMPLFFPLYERLLAEYNLPDELKYLSIVESSLNPRAVSHAGAGGLWQFMPGTGRELQLYQDEYVDERMDPVKATVAACLYLRDLYNIFGDWELAMAAYNCGPNAVKRAMRRTGKATFYELYDALPKETRGYVPQFVAFTYVLNHAADHGIVAENFEQPIPIDTLCISGYCNLETLARVGRIAVADLKKMNPAISMGILPTYTERYPLRVPRKNIDFVRQNRKMILDSAGRQPIVPTLLADNNLRADTGKSAQPKQEERDANSKKIMASVKENAEKQAGLNRKLAVAVSADKPQEDVETVVLEKPGKRLYVVKPKDNLGDLADRFGVEVYDLKRWNQLKTNTLQPGQKLVVYQEKEETRTEQLANQGMPEARKKRTVSEQNLGPRYHMVQEGDTLWNISQRYEGLTIERLKQLNNMRSNALRLGQKLIVG